MRRLDVPRPSPAQFSQVWAQMCQQPAPAPFIAKRVAASVSDTLTAMPQRNWSPDERASHRPDGQVTPGIEILHETICREPLRIVEQADQRRRTGGLILIHGLRQLCSAKQRVSAIRHHDEIEGTVADVTRFHHDNRFRVRPRPRRARNGRCFVPVSAPASRRCKVAALNAESELAVDHCRRSRGP